MENDNILLDNTISSKALKAYKIILLLDPKDNPAAHSIGNILMHFKEGRDSIRSAINELLKYKYIERFQTREKDGALSYTQYNVIK